jgi:hypothetical protein
MEHDLTSSQLHHVGAMFQERSITGPEAGQQPVACKGRIRPAQLINDN